MTVDPSNSTFLYVAAQRNSGVAAISLVLYDILITLDKEIQHFWGRSFSLIQLIYFLNRYYGLLIVLIYLYGDMLQVFPDDLFLGIVHSNQLSSGERIVQFGAWSGWTMILLSDAIMAIRVHALFERTKTTTIFLGSLYLAQGLIMMGILIGYDQRFNDFASHEIRACGVVAPKWCSFFWIPTLIFEFILLCMTLYKAMAYSCPILGGSSTYRRHNLYRILVRDQIIYFTSILFSGCVNIALWTQLSENTPNNEAITLTTAIPCVLGARILMSLREAVAWQDDDSEATMSLNLISPRVIGG